ncbi:MAG: hypothetical protein GC179_11550 [Anaerolineaceae bacterium]|nr:hypothetical protein [Anaerolineaceae bacterium]
MSVKVNVPVYLEFLEYLATFAPPEKILEYTISSDMQEHLEELFDKNNEGELTAEERQQLDDFIEFDRHIILLKARAAARLRSAS